MQAAVSQPQPQPQRGNPAGVRARVTDHAIRRYAERALGVWVEAADDTAALTVLRRRGVNVGAIRERIAVAGGLGVANGAVAVIADGRKLVLQGPAVVTVLAPKLRIDRVASGPTSPVPAARRRTVLDKDFPGHD